MFLIYDTIQKRKYYWFYFLAAAKALSYYFVMHPTGWDTVCSSSYQRILTLWVFTLAATQKKRIVWMGEIIQICYWGQVSLDCCRFSDNLTPLEGNIYLAGDGALHVKFSNLMSLSQQSLHKKSCCSEFFLE